MERDTSATWWSRNWKWVGWLTLFGGLTAVALFATLLTFFLVTGVRSTHVYSHALEIAQADPQVVRELGEPVEAGWMVRASFELSDESGEAEIQIPLSGPLGSGTLFVTAYRDGGIWLIELLEVQVEGRSQTIDLMQDSEPTGFDQV